MEDEDLSDSGAKASKPLSVLNPQTTGGAQRTSDKNRS